MRLHSLFLSGRDGRRRHDGLVGARRVRHAVARRVRAEREDAGGHQADDEARDDPADRRLEEHPLVAAAVALEERDAGGGAHLAVGRGGSRYPDIFGC